jgi:hypothetical protein
MPKDLVTIFTMAFLCACSSNKRHLIITNTSEKGTIYVKVSINGKVEFKDTIPKAVSSISYIDHGFDINVDGAEIDVDIPKIGVRKIEQVEQSAQQTAGVNIADNQVVLDANSPMHRDAIQAENPINGNIRMLELEGGRIRDKTYTKYFLNKGGLT